MVRFEKAHFLSDVLIFRHNWEMWPHVGSFMGAQTVRCRLTVLRRMSSQARSLPAWSRPNLNAMFAEPSLYVATLLSGRSGVGCRAIQVHLLHILAPEIDGV